MSPRKRTSKNADLPTGLSAFNKRNTERFRYRYPDGRDFFFPVGTSRQDAKEAAAIFNAKYRSPSIGIPEQTDRYNKPLSEFLPAVVNRVKAEESLTDETLRTFEQDIERLNKLLGGLYSKSLTLEHVNDFLNEYCAGKSNNVYNRKISFLEKVFSYIVDMSGMTSNPAKLKKRKPKEKKIRQRLKLDEFHKIYAVAPEWLQIAMDLALQTTHAVNEISKLKYRHYRKLEQPEFSSNFPVFGYLRIHRQKTQDKEASRVEIPVSNALKSVIERSRDKVLSPYVVHRIGRYREQVGEGCDHPTQVSSKYISREFSKLRDKVGIRSDIPKEERPTFHEIRALACHLFDQAGYDPQARMAHSDAKSTQIYRENHIEWVRVPVAELVFETTV